tara:strand:+ start:587 stop:850 length:264 start_codon:yes stop_codon:yes gene_type:complete
MTKETPISLDQISIETLRILETNLALQYHMTHPRDETDASPMRIRMPQVTYTPPPPKLPIMAILAFGLVATGFFMGVWAACAVAFLI